MSYASRTVSGLMLFALLAVESFRVRRGCAMPSGSVARTGLAMVLFLAVAVPAFVHTYRFGAWIRSCEEIAVESTGWVPIDETDAGRDGGYLTRYHWGWDPFDPRTLGENPVGNYRRSRGLGNFWLW
jgi:hypothetical protein